MLRLVFIARGDRMADIEEVSGGDGVATASSSSSQVLSHLIDSVRMPPPAPPSAPFQPTGQFRAAPQLFPSASHTAHNISEEEENVPAHSQPNTEDEMHQRRQVDARAADAAESMDVDDVDEAAAKSFTREDVNVVAPPSSSSVEQHPSQQASHAAPAGPSTLPHTTHTTPANMMQANRTWILNRAVELQRQEGDSLCSEATTQLVDQKKMQCVGMCMLA